MAAKWQLLLVALVATAALGAGKDDRKVYRWVDDKGVVHFGDAVPPESSAHDRQVLNDFGVAVESIDGQVTDEERAEREAARLAAENAEREKQAKQVRDATLLDTYLNVEEIEDLRDRRAQMLDGQIHYTMLYLEALREKLARLQADAARFRPYSSNPDAPPIHENLAKELSDTLDSIIRYERTLADARESRVQLVAKFDQDIDRFKELTSSQ
jgi:hypothetical protein